jgi:regulator of cell morphogenesis and NO signaling
MSRDSAACRRIEERNEDDGEQESGPGDLTAERNGSGEAHLAWRGSGRLPVSAATYPVALQMSVEEALSRVPRAAVVFEVLGLDVCCGRSKSLAEAAKSAGVDPNEILNLLEGREVGAPAAFRDSESLTELTDYIVSKYHRRARWLLIELTILSRETSAGHGDRQHPLWDVKDAVDQLVRELIPHMRAEERYLFPYINSMGSPTPDRTIMVPLYGTIDYPLQSLRHDHSRDVTAMSDLRAITGDFIPLSSSCERVRKMYAMLEDFDLELQRHVELEDHTLFPRAIEWEQKLGRPGQASTADGDLP